MMEAYKKGRVAQWFSAHFLFEGSTAVQISQNSLDKSTGLTPFIGSLRFKLTILSEE